MLKKLVTFYALTVVLLILTLLVYQPPISLKEATLALSVKRAAKDLNFPLLIKLFCNHNVPFFYFLGLMGVYKLTSLLKAPFVSLVFLRLFSFSFVVAGVILSLLLFESPYLWLLFVLCCASSVKFLCLASELSYHGYYFFLSVLTASTLYSFVTSPKKITKILFFVGLILLVINKPVIVLVILAAGFIASVLFRKGTFFELLLSPVFLTVLGGFGVFYSLMLIHFCGKTCFLSWVKSFLPSFKHEHYLTTGLVKSVCFYLGKGLGIVAVLFVISPVLKLISKLRGMSTISLPPITTTYFLLAFLGLTLVYFEKLLGFNLPVFVFPLMLLFLFGLSALGYSLKTYTYMFLLASAVIVAIFFGKRWTLSEKVSYRIEIMKRAIALTGSQKVCFWKESSPIFRYYLPTKSFVVSERLGLNRCKVVVSKTRLQGYEVAYVFLDPYGKSIWYVLRKS